MNIGGELSASAELRVRFVLARFAAAVATAAVHSVARGPGRVHLRGEVRLVDGGCVELTAEDDASEAAMVHFIDRLGRAVARRRTHPGGRHG